MQHFTSRNLIQDITYWQPANGGATNDFGHSDQMQGVLIKGRWEDRTQQIRKPNGEEIASMAEVFVDRDVAIGGFLALGDHSGGALLPGAQEIQDVRKIPDLRNLATERRAYL